MRGPVTLSFLLHVAVLLIAWLGLPSLSNRVVDTAPVIDVSLVTDVSQAPAVVREPKTKKVVEKPKPPKPKQEQQASLPKAPPPPPSPPAPPPPPKDAVPVQKEPAPKPVPAPKPKPQPEKTAKPEPKPKPQPKPKPEPEKTAKPEPKPKPKPAPKKVAKQDIKPAPTPPKKPKPPPVDDFASVMKTVENLPRQKTAKKAKKGKESFDQEIEDALKKHDTEAQTSQPQQVSRLEPSERMSMSEIDALRRQIEHCWNPPAGAPDAQNLVVEADLDINPDGTVRRAQIVDAARMSRDPFYRAAAESVLRAINNPMCTPLKLPPGKYDLWRHTRLTFDPHELVGR